MINLQKVEKNSFYGVNIVIQQINVPSTESGEQPLQW